MKRVFDLCDGLGKTLSKECLYILDSTFIYCRVKPSKRKFEATFYLSKFHTKDIVLMKRPVSVKGRKVLIDFPTKKEIDSVLGRHRGRSKQ